MKTTSVPISEPEQQQIAAPEPENTPPPVSEGVKSKLDTQAEPQLPASPPAGNGRPRAKERAEAVVRDLLANGSAPGESVKAAAVNAFLSVRTLIAAAERLGVRCRRGEWWLPS